MTLTSDEDLWGSGAGVAGEHLLFITSYGFSAWPSCYVCSTLH